MIEIARVTINDIARQAGLSKGSVSYALNGKPGVSDETRQRVAEIARQLGWTPSQAARSLSRSRADTIGIVLSRPPRMLAVEPFHMEFISGLEEVISAHGVTLMLHMVASSADVVPVYERWWAQRRVDGVILTDFEEADPRVEAVKRIGLPAICMTNADGAGGLPYVQTDDSAAIVAAVHHLLGLGHRRIARVAGPANYSHIAARNRGYTELMSAEGLVSTIVDTDFTGEEGARATRELLISSQRPTAIIFDNDIMAVAALGVAAELGVSVPGELSILAWDDSMLCQITNPPLSAMHRDIAALGGTAARLLLEFVGSGHVESEHATKSTILVRGSTGPAPA